MELWHETHLAGQEHRRIKKEEMVSVDTFNCKWIMADQPCKYPSRVISSKTTCVKSARMIPT